MAKYKPINVKLMDNYFIGKVINALIERTYDGFERKVSRTVTETEIGMATTEVQKKRAEIDASTYPFAQDLSKKIYDGEEARVLMLVRGTFGGYGGSIESIIPRDLGANPYELFKPDFTGTTIDNYVTQGQVRKFIGEHLKEFKDYTYFDIIRSFFFYLRPEDAQRFSKGGILDMKRLVPLLVPTDYVVLENVSRPSLNEYVESAPVFTSYRLKKSMTEKLLQRMKSGHLGPIKDWAGHRIVVNTMDEVDKWYDYFKEGQKIKIGSCRVEVQSKEDRYKHPPPSGFKSKEVVVRVTVRGFEKCVREIQIIDRPTYWHDEFVPGIRFHVAHERRRRHRPRTHKDVYPHYEGILESIFGPEETRIEILRI